MKMKRRLCLFTRYPQAGQTKTRLIPVLGARGAADLQRALTEHIVVQIRAFQRAQPAELQVWHTDDDAGRMRRWLGSDASYRPQAQGDIGRRMLKAFEAAAAEGCRHTILIGADIPGITPPLLSDAFDLLQKYDMALGPAFDGGYYLIGLETGHLPPRSEKLFDDIDWGRRAVYEQTLAAAGALGLSVGRLARLPDIDRPADLSVWENIQQARGGR